MNTTCETSDLLVFSHLRWDFVFQRPQHLLSRFAKYRRVFYFEEPVFGMTDIPRMHMRETVEGIHVVIPYLPANIKPEDMEAALKDLVDDLMFEEVNPAFTLWYYTPMALSFSRHLEPQAIIFDCMDELSLFKGAPQTLIDLEAELMNKADVVFTGGQSLYEVKKHAHHNIHALPSSIDYEHFSKGRQVLVEPDDQVHIPHPRVGFYGVIDERFDIELLEQMATKAPHLQFIILGPVIKIDPEALPRRSNIFYLGKKDYKALPLYLAGWDCAMMPFALNESTKFISPTKTPEYLAAGKPVVSTAIRDVVCPYKEKNLVHIASSPDEFIRCIHKAMSKRVTDPKWLEKVDWFLSHNSWDITFEKVVELEMRVTKHRVTGEHSVHISAGGVI
ncbi:MAG TPA: glycosyltransferase family 1 protein [Bacteriovoracaceae bacterium]|nr:glycosyltransferase family 1 protein [Bacteriovoracaceae bacterium]